MFPTTELDIHLVQEPSRTPPGFPVAERLGEERGELDVPLTQGFMTNDNAALAQPFLIRLHSALGYACPWAKLLETAKARNAA